MRNVFTIGQSVFDILFRKNKPFASKVGGSMLNTSVSLGRLGVNVFFIGEYGNDFAGNITHDFLNENNVNTNFVYRYPDGQTTISLAFLGNENNATYNFYRNIPEKRLDINLPKVNKNDIILFGSFYIFDHAIEEKILPFLQEAKNKGAILLYDPNFRKPHYEEIYRLKSKFIKYFELADIIRGSDEDFYGIFGTKSFKELLQVFPNKNAVLVYTMAEKGIHVAIHNMIKIFKVEKIKPVSTIGAGDTFNAGIIYSLIKGDISKEDITFLSEDTISRIIEQAISFASHVCLLEDNYLSVDFCRDIQE